MIAQRKFTNREINEIRYLSDNGITQNVIARGFDVSNATIGKIVNGKTYKDIEHEKVFEDFNEAWNSLDCRITHKEKS